MTQDQHSAPERWKLVPTMPTDEMLVAMLSEGESAAHASCDDPRTASALLRMSGVLMRYDAMLAASPQPPAPQAEAAPATVAHAVPPGYRLQPISEFDAYQRVIAELESRPATAAQAGAMTDLASTVERLALKHIAPNAKAMFPDKDYRETEQYRRVLAFAEELLADPPPVAHAGAMLTDEQRSALKRAQSLCVSEGLADIAFVISDMLAAAPVSAPVADSGAMTDEHIREHFETHASYALEGKKLYWNGALSFAHALLAAVKPVSVDSVDAQRYRVVRQAAYQFGVSNPRPDELDDAVDAARAALSTGDKA